jgi:uncharacterized protein
MFINIKELGPEGIRLDDEIAIDPFSWEGGQTVRCGPVRVTGSMQPSARGVELTARVRTVARMDCTRCVEAFDHVVDASFRLVVISGAGEGPDREDGESRVDPDAVDAYTVEGERLDLRDVLREQIDLALPLAAVCSPECRGFCAGCGARLDAESCRCPRRTAESRSELREIREILARKSDRGRSKGD